MTRHSAPPSFVERVRQDWYQHQALLGSVPRLNDHVLAVLAVETLINIPVLEQGIHLSNLGYTLGRWTEDLQHADPCDCDEDEETAGTRCLDNSPWRWALLRDEGGFAPSFAFALSEVHEPASD